MRNIHFIKFAAISVLGANACFPAQAGPPKEIVAVFFQTETEFSETVTLYADGQYQQSETQAKPKLYHGSLAPFPNLLDWQRNPERSGKWYLLAKEGSPPMTLKEGENFPSGALIELKGAMPFGETWENQLPFSLHGDRLLPASSFKVTPPAVPAPHRTVVITFIPK